MEPLKKRRLKLTPIVIGVVFLLILIQLVISHNLANSGEKLRDFEVGTQELKEENTILAEEINKAGSLSRISQEAEKAGLVRTTQVLHLTPQIPVALGR